MRPFHIHLFIIRVYTVNKVITNIWNDFNLCLKRVKCKALRYRLSSPINNFFEMLEYAKNKIIKGKVSMLHYTICLIQKITCIVI